MSGERPPPPARVVSEAAERGDIEAVTASVREGASVNTPDEGGATPLHYAARRGALDVVQYLVRRGARLSPTTRLWAHTPLHWAAHEGHAPVVAYLAKHVSARGKEGLDARSSSGDTPLIMAAAADRLSTVEALLDAGANAGIKGAEERTAVQWASKRRHANVVELLVARGCNIVERAGKHKSVLEIGEKDRKKGNPSIANAIERGRARWTAQSQAEAGKGK